MKRELEMKIKVPADMVQDFRLFIVLHGGEIVSTKNSDKKKEEK